MNSLSPRGTPPPPARSRGLAPDSPPSDALRSRRRPEEPSNLDPPPKALLSPYTPRPSPADIDPATTDADPMPGTRLISTSLIGRPVLSTSRANSPSLVLVDGD